MVKKRRNKGNKEKKGGLNRVTNLSRVDNNREISFVADSGPPSIL